MREVSERLAQMLDGSRQVTWEANISRDDSVLSGLPVMLDGSLSWSAGQMVEFAGGIRVPIQDASGISRAPREQGDLFAPFGSEVTLVCRIAAGGEVERVQVARARIHKVPSVTSGRMPFRGQWATFAEVISLDLRDRMDVLHRDEFDGPTMVRHPGSAWTELAHLSPFPVVRSGTDATLPQRLTYEGTRAEAAQVVAQHLGGVAAFDSFGNLIVRRQTEEAALTLRLGPSGTVASVGSVMDSERVYNRVRVVGKAADGTPIVAVREATGDLAPSRWGRRTYTDDQGENIATQTHAEEYAGRLLARVSTVRTAELEVQCLLDPRLEPDDVAAVEHGGLIQRIRATKITYGDTYMTVTGDVVP